MEPTYRTRLVQLAYMALCVKSRPRKAVMEALTKDAAMTGLTQREREQLAREIITEALCK